MCPHYQICKILIVSWISERAIEMHTHNLTMHGNETPVSTCLRCICISHVDTSHSSHTEPYVSPGSGRKASASQNPDIVMMFSSVAKDKQRHGIK